MGDSRIVATNIKLDAIIILLRNMNNDTVMSQADEEMIERALNFDKTNC